MYQSFEDQFLYLSSKVEFCLDVCLEKIFYFCDHCFCIKYNYCFKSYLLFSVYVYLLLVFLSLINLSLVCFFFSIFLLSVSFACCYKMCQNISNYYVFNFSIFHFFVSLFFFFLLERLRTLLILFSSNWFYVFGLLVSFHFHKWFI